MKKILFLLIVSITTFITVQAQKKSDSSFTVKSSVPKNFVEVTKDSVLKVTDFKAIKFIEIAGRTFNVPLLTQAEVVFTYPEWVVAIYQILENSSTGLSKSQVSNLQQILEPYVRAYQEKQKQNQKQ